MTEKVRLGVIVPSVNTVVDNWYPKIVPDGVSVHFSRMLIAWKLARGHLDLPRSGNRIGGREPQPTDGRAQDDRNDTSAVTRGRSNPLWRLKVR
jgi:hypothetical protein